MSASEFDMLIDAMPMVLEQPIDIPESTVEERHMIPNDRDYFIFRHLCFTRRSIHTHDYYEIDFVEKGFATLAFEDRTIELCQGDIYILAPNARHDILISDENTRLYSMSLRASTFDAVFFSVLSTQDLMAQFFRSTLNRNNEPNYLKFHVDDVTQYSRYIRHILIESHIYDIYANNAGVSYTYLFLSSLLRYYSDTANHYTYMKDSEPLLILQYIQNNYRNVSLAFLAEFFHYTESYLCKVIKQHTGKTFSELVRQTRMRHAVDLLIKSDMKVSDIGEFLGYNSTDHFSRVFKSMFHMSPQLFRKTYKIYGGF